MSRRRRLAGDSGQVAGIEAVPFGLLVFVTGALVVAHTWGIVDAKFLTTTAAREATRSFVEAPSSAAAARAASRAVEGVIAGSGRGPAGLGLRRVDQGFDRCRPVTFEATYRLPSVGLPWGRDRPSIVVRSRHSEVIDPFGDGLPGAAECDGQP